MLTKTLFLSVLLALILAACSGGSSEQSSTAMQPVTTSSELSATTQPAATAETAPVQTAAVSFAADVLPIFEESCTRCHGGSRQSGGLRLDSYAALMAGGDEGAVVIPNDAAGSLLVELITSGKMPRNAASLPADELTLITDWVNAGARDN